MKNDPQKFAQNINTKVLPKLRILDWALSFATLGWGIWKMSWPWMGFGVLCVIMAWLDPGAYIKRGLERMFLGRHRRPPAPSIVMPSMASNTQKTVVPEPEKLWPYQQEAVMVRSRDGIMNINYGMNIPPQVRE
ncbi:MAG TPA: hypothetical protein DCW68_05285 [Rhodospirillaceae bacterium]|nr:MAG: hypothetical protein A2018_02365 [Alphaproteobacteria bacterium GWF2_58_20]HAU29508.1 hypothetical protein [Rhodospirillaceae bacterium]